MLKIKGCKCLCQDPELPIGGDSTNDYAELVAVCDACGKDTCLWVQRTATFDNRCFVIRADTKERLCGECYTKKTESMTSNDH